MTLLWDQTLAGAPLSLWLGFAAVLATTFLVDLALPRSLSPTHRAAGYCGSVALCTLLFGAAVTHTLGSAAGLQFLTGYLLEEALSIDNLFVFLVVFRFFKIPAPQQQRVLFWGIFGALLLRAGFIAAGIALVQRFDWIFYVFGALLVFTGIKLARQSDHATPPDQSLLVRLFRRAVPSTPQLHGDAFWVRDATGRLLATPLLLVLWVIEMSDVVFAVDSIPAIFSITTHPTLVYTSNICALLGLRSLYALLAATLDSLRGLHYGLSAVLIFIGLKMLAHAHLHIGTLLSLAVICACLAASVLLGRLLPPDASKKH